MQTFDTDIENVTFSFVRVTYGKGDLWYHISYSKDDKRITFRINNSSNGTWKVVDTQDPYLLDLESHFDDCIANFEKKLLTLPAKVDVINAAARLIK
jgi:hypothetical protein